MTLFFARCTLHIFDLHFVSKSQIVTKTGRAVRGQSFKNYVPRIVYTYVSIRFPRIRFLGHSSLPFTRFHCVSRRFYPFPDIINVHIVRGPCYVAFFFQFRFFKHKFSSFVTCFLKIPITSRK